MTQYLPEQPEPIPDWMLEPTERAMTEQQQLDSDFDETTRFGEAVGVVIAAALLLVFLARCALWPIQSHAATTVSRQGGTADFACCEDANCDKPIGSQYVRDWAAKDACQALTDADGKVRYFRQWPMRIERVGAPPAPPACPAKPADETQPGVCPAGTAGSWTQTRTYASAPAPTCWAAGAWTPASAPSGACVSQPPPPPPTPNAPANLIGTVAPNATTPVNSNVTLTWSAVTGAAEYEVWRCAGATCTNFAFIPGADVTATTYTNSNLPPGVTYRYRVRVWKPVSGPYSDIVTVTTTAVTPPPPQANGSSLIEWRQVPLNTDGTPATIAGYQIHYSTVGVAGPSLNQVLDVKDFAIAPCIQFEGVCAQKRVTSLTPGPWAFAVSAYDTQGRHSPSTNYVTKQIE